MFVVDTRRELVGYSIWPWDGIYTPVVGCFWEGRLVAHASCNLDFQPVGLDGPHQQWWFRMRVDADVRNALQSGDPSAGLCRLEDGEPVPYAGNGERVDKPGRHWRAEHFLSFSSNSRMKLDGFGAFLGAPAMHQLDILFLDILNRLPDPEARLHYGRILDTGESILALRPSLLGSEEFGLRRISPTDRIGSLMTSPLWRELSRSEPLGEVRSQMSTIRMSSYDGMSDAEFGRQIHVDVHGDDASDAASAHFTALAATHGRREVVMLLVRAASVHHRYHDVVDS